MSTEGIGVYALGTAALLNTEVSSTYEGRHLTFLESDITTLDPSHAFQQKGHPCMVGDDIVGVAFTTCTADTDYVAIDTEGIFYLTVDATVGNQEVTVGDQLYINKATAVISNDDNKATNAHFGYALGGVAEGVTAVIAVKVHWSPDDAEEKVGTSGTPLASDLASVRFREYYYEATNGGYPKGDYLALTISTTFCVSAQAIRRVLKWTADGNWVHGYAAVAEFDLEVAPGDASMDTTCVVFLTSNIGPLTATGHNNYLLSWIRIQDHASAAGDQVNLLFEITDDLAGYPRNDDDSLFTQTSQMTNDFALLIMVNNVKYWIMLANARA